MNRRGLILFALLLGTILYTPIPTLADYPSGWINDPYYQASESLSDNTVATVGEDVDWPLFWQTFRQYALWDLEWFDGSQWVSVKDDLDVQLSYPEPNYCKINLVFDASHQGNYRLTFAINKAVRQYVSKVGQYQYDLTYDDYSITFDWSDCAEIPGLVFTHGVLEDLFWFRIRRDNVPLGVHVEIDPSTVATSTTRDVISYGFQRKGFYAEGLFWAFYSDGTDAGWKFSNDGTTWIGGFTSIGTCTDGWYFSVWFDGIYVHYARLNYATYDLFYRRGTPVNDGSITWSAVEQTVYNGASTSDQYMYPCITVDTNGYAWIGAYYDAGTIESPYVLKNANNDGTWATDFAYQLNAADWSTVTRVCPVPLTDGKVYVIYCRNSNAPCGKLYNAGWGGEETDLADYNIEDGYGFSAVALGDNIHFVYNRDVTYQFRHNERVWGVGWNVNDVLIQDTMTGNSGLALSVDPSTSDLYCFWLRSATNHIYYKNYTSGAWQGLVDWIDESVDGTNDYRLSSFYMDYGGYIGLLYVTRTVSPYNVRFDFLTTVVGGSTNYPRSATQGFIVSSDADRWFNGYRDGTQGISLSSEGNRLFNGLRAAIQSITASMDTSRLYVAHRNAAQALTLSSDTTRAYQGAREGTQNLGVSTDADRGFTGARESTQGIGVDIDGDRVYGSIRGGSQTIGVTPDGERIYGGVRSPTQGVTLSSSTSRALTMKRGASQAISTLFNVTSVLTKALVSYIRGATLNLNIGYITNRSLINILIQVIDRLGGALAGSNVALYYGGSLVEGGEVNATGHYLADNVPQGNYTIDAYRTDYAPQKLNYLLVTSYNIEITLQTFEEAIMFNMELLILVGTGMLLSLGFYLGERVMPWFIALIMGALGGILFLAAGFYWTVTAPSIQVYGWLFTLWGVINLILVTYFSIGLMRSNQGAYPQDRDLYGDTV